MPLSPHVSRSWVGVMIDTREIVLKQLRNQWCHLVSGSNYLYCIEDINCLVAHVIYPLTLVLDLLFSLNFGVYFYYVYYSYL